MAQGGDIIELTFNHPTIGTGTFYPKSNEDSTFVLGGFVSNDDANSIDGGGNMIDQMNRVRWSFQGTLAWDMNNSNDLQKIQSLVNSPVQASWTITHINGTVWGGTGKPVGDYSGNGNAATFPVKIAGGSVLKKIVG